MVSYFLFLKCLRGDHVTRDYSYWELSMAVRAQVRTVPILYNPVEEEDDDEVENVREKKGLQLFSPYYVDPANCGENKGFLEIVTQMHIQSLPKIVNKEYPLVRLDVSLMMAWFRVNFFVFFLPLVRIPTLLKA